MRRTDNAQRRGKVVFRLKVSLVLAVSAVSALMNNARRPMRQFRYPSHSLGSTKNVFVASHRRSGTHLLMNFVYNHFDATLLTIKKTNHLAADDYLGCACLNGMFSSGKVIYVEREFHSVLQSMFYYMRSFDNNYKVTENTSLTNFLRNDELVLDIAWMWFHTHRTWMQFVHSGDVLYVTFNGLLEKPTESMQNISTFLGVKANIRARKRDVGVLVGVGKGLQLPGQDVIVKAQWALSVIESHVNTQRDYSRSWGGLVYSGKYPLHCDTLPGSRAACPKTWHDGEVLTSTTGCCR